MQSKRVQIIRAALERYRTHAICGSTLKDIAAASGVPLGNLYYYFKTREELLLAVLDECERELQALLDRLAPLAPRDWLAAYFAWLLEDPAASTELGCPFGTLAVELRALGDPAAPRAAGIVRRYREAVSAQTRALGADQAPDEVFLAVQGAYTVSRVLKDAELFQQGVTQVRDRLLGPSPR